MQDCNFSNCLVKADNVCDYIPLVSTVSNAFNLFQKAVFIPFMDKKAVLNNHYYNHLEDKSLSRMLLSLSGIGIVWIVYSDLKEAKANEKKQINLIRQHQGRIEGMLGKDMNNPKLIAAAIQAGNPSAFESATPKVRGIREIALRAIEKDGMQLEHATAFQSDREVVEKAVMNQPLAFRFVNSELQLDTSFVFELYQKTPLLYSTITYLSIADTSGHFKQILEGLSSKIHTDLDCPEDLV